MFLKSCILSINSFAFCFVLLGQNFSVGNTSITFFDSLRNRNINTEIYYPSDYTGQDEPVSNGTFPVIIFGHGYLIEWSAYENFWNALVPEGYILCFPTTEMGFTPNHQFFADDIKFIASQMQIENQNNSSIFFNTISANTALMGHSMGGGASFLAAESNPNINTLVNFAAAETNPSAITATQNISIPTLIFSGDDDCVAPPVNHQDIMYNALNSNCKTQIKIINGGHCYFANENVLCSFGESSCNSNLSILRNEQQEITNNFLKPWLDFSLKENQSSFVVFNDSLQASSRITYSQFCNGTAIMKQRSVNELKIYPNPVFSSFQFQIPKDHLHGEIIILNIIGHQIFKKTITKKLTNIDLSNFDKGSYFIFYQKENKSWINKLIKLDTY